MQPTPLNTSKSLVTLILLSGHSALASIYTREHAAPDEMIWKVLPFSRPQMFSKSFPFKEARKWMEVLFHWQSCRDRFSCLPLEIPGDWPGYPAWGLLHLLTHLKNNTQGFLCDVRWLIFLWVKRQIRGRQKTAASGLPTAQWHTTISKCVLKKWEQERSGGVQCCGKSHD